MKKINVIFMLMSFALSLGTVFSVRAAALSGEQSVSESIATLYLSYAQDIVDLVDAGHVETLEYKEFLSEHILVLHRAMGLDDDNYHMNKDFLAEHYQQLLNVKAYVHEHCCHDEASFKAAERMIAFIGKHNRDRMNLDNGPAEVPVEPSLNERWALKMAGLIKDNSYLPYEDLIVQFKREHIACVGEYKPDVYQDALKDLIQRVNEITISIALASKNYARRAVIEELRRICQERAEALHTEAPAKPTFNEKWAGKFLNLVSTNERDVEMYRAMINSYKTAYTLTHGSLKPVSYKRDLHIVDDFLADRGYAISSGATEVARAALRDEMDLVSGGAGARMHVVS